MTLEIHLPPSMRSHWVAAAREFRRMDNARGEASLGKGKAHRGKGKGQDKASLPRGSSLSDGKGEGVQPLLADGGGGGD